MSKIPPRHAMRHHDTGEINKTWPQLVIVAIVAWLVFAVVPSLFAMDGKGPMAGSLPLDESGQMQVDQEDRCPVCGMKAIEHRKFASAIQMNDNTTYYFCGTGCMIRSWVHPEIFLARPTTDLKRPVVKEYFSGRETDARDIIFVAGSDIIGPMGPALVPVMDAASVKVFKKRHGGKTEFLLKDMSDARWFEITGKKMNR